MKVLITGAGGFVGSHLIEYLFEQEDYDIFVTTYSKNESLQELLPADHAFQGDLTDQSFVEKVMKTSQPEIIFHLASISTVQGSEKIANKIITNNTLLQLNMLEATKMHAPSSRFIAICSADQYGNVTPEDIPISEDTPLHPTNPYAVSKLVQELLTLKYHRTDGLDVVILRPFNHTGERQLPNFVVPAFAKQIALIEQGKQDPVITVGNLETTRDFTDVKDMVRAYALAAKKGKSGEIYNIGSGKGVKIQAILDSLIELSSSDIAIKNDPDRMRPSDVPVLIADNTKFVSATGWKPEISIDKTLERVLNYWRTQKEQK